MTVAKTGKFGDLKRRLIFLVLALVVYRIGAHIPVPGIDPTQLAELFKQKSGAHMQHIAYKGASGAVIDVIAGHIQAVSTTLTTTSAAMRAGRVRAGVQLSPSSPQGAQP